MLVNLSFTLVMCKEILSLKIKSERNIMRNFKLVFCFGSKTELSWSHTPGFSHARLDVVAG